MTKGRIRRWPWAVTVLAILVLAGAVVLTLRNDTFGLFVIVAGIMVTGYGVVGGFLATRVPANPIGWLMLTIAVSFALAGVSDEYIVYSTSTDPGSLPFVSAVAWISSFTFYGLLIPILVILLVFPDGKLMTPRWRGVLYAVVGSGAVLVVAAMVKPGLIEDTGVTNPLGIEALGGPLRGLTFIASAVLLVAALASVAAVVIRYRRAPGAERQQIRPLAWVAGTALVILLTGIGLQAVRTAPFINDLIFTAFFATIGIGLPLTIQNAVLRHRLYDLEVVVKKTVIFAIVVLLLVAVAGVAAILVGFGVVPSLYDYPPMLLLVGVAYGLLVVPAYRLATRLADRLVYGGRATPSEVLSEFSERLSETYATDDVLPRMAAILGGATRAKAVHVWLLVGHEFRVTAAWPTGADEAPVVSPEHGLPAFPDDLHRTEVRDRGELLGAITASFHANDPLDEGRERLIRDMAAQAGLVLRNVRLIENLRASRQRMVAAQDEGRRRLERNIHDGAQQQLVALSVKTRLADTLIDRDAAKAHEMLAQIQSDTNDALETLRDLARGIYPPLLADKGLATALAAQGRKVAVPVTLDADRVGRYPAETEATVYFCVLEAMQNVAKYAQASGIEVRLRTSDRALTFEVSDDGVGFDPNTHTPGTGIQGMQDRLDAVGGSLLVRSSPGHGTVVTGSVPISTT